MVAGLCFLLGALADIRGRRSGAWLTAAGAAILTGAISARGLRSGYWPLTNEYEFALAFALGTALAALAAGTVKHGRDPAIQAATMTVAAFLVAYASLVMPAFKRVSQPLLPALDSIWLLLHVGSAAIAYGALALAGAAGFVWLRRQSNRSSTAWLQERAIAAGYPFLTLSMIFGLIWAQVAWGRYWGWDLKEVWTLITWLVYALYWHLRRRVAWQGRRSAWLALAGLAAVFFTFLGVGWLARAVGLDSLHLF